MKLAFACACPGAGPRIVSGGRLLAACAVAGTSGHSTTWLTAKTALLCTEYEIPANIMRMATSIGPERVAGFSSASSLEMCEPP